MPIVQVVRAGRCVATPAIPGRPEAICYRIAWQQASGRTLEEALADTFDVRYDTTASATFV